MTDPVFSREAATVLACEAAAALPLEVRRVFRDAVRAADRRDDLGGDAEKLYARILAASEVVSG